MWCRMRYRLTWKAHQQTQLHKSTCIQQIHNHRLYRISSLPSISSFPHLHAALQPVPRRYYSAHRTLQSRSTRNIPSLAECASIYPRDRSLRRSQHTQSLEIEQDDSEDLIRDEQGEKIVDSTSESAQQKSFIDDLVLGGFDLSSTTTSGAIDALLYAVGKLVPNATPVVQYTLDSSLESRDDSSGMDCTLQVVLSNTEYKISCTKTFILASGEYLDIKTAFEELAHTYLWKLAERCQHDEYYEGGADLLSLHVLQRVLELGRITVYLAVVNIDKVPDHSLQLFRAQVYVGQEALGYPQIWTDALTAERLARASAYAAVLERAEQADIDVEAIKQSIKVPQAREKKQTELQRVAARDVPRVYDASISQRCITAILYTLNNLRLHGLPDDVQLKPFQPLEAVNRQSSRRKRHAPPRIKTPSPKSQSIQEQRNKLPIRQAGVVSRLCNLVKENDVLILVSETGSGKTTQLPQILLEEAQAADIDAACKIVCTQPRRIAATSVATRVAQERETYLGGSVGYHVRFDNQMPVETGSITYSTAGVLLKLLQDNSDEVLNETSHIVVDEVHERDLTVDLLLAFLRNLLRRRKLAKQHVPKIILMSATMKAVDFEQYFAEDQDGVISQVASITVPGRAHSVTAHMLDDIIPTFMAAYADDQLMMSLLKDSHGYLEWEDELAEELAAFASVQQPSQPGQREPERRVPSQIDPWRDALIPNSLMTAVVIHALRCDEAGDILIFLPGMKEMDDLADMLKRKVPADLAPSDQDKVRLFKLHSALYETNAHVFEPIPRGCRRIILATNIAQTSITLPDVVHVIDPGKRRQKVYDQIGRKNDFSSTWIDQATSHQRRGRAGRVQSGHYWAMFSEARFASMPEKASPEILTSDLTTSSLILKSHSNDIDLREFFAHTIDAPDPAIVTACIDELKELGMLTADESITPLGKCCSDFPLHPAQARGLLIGRLLGCFTPLMLVACHDANTPLIHSPVKRKDMYHATIAFADLSDDDRFAFIQAFLEYDDAYRHNSAEALGALKENHVRHDSYQYILRTARQIYDIMSDYGLVREEVMDRKVANIFDRLSFSYDVNSHRTNLFKALALSVVDTNLAVWDEKEQCWLAKDIKCMLRPYSVNTMQSLKLMHRLPVRKSGEVVGFTEMVNNVITSPRPCLVETSSITPLTAMLFGGPIAVINDHTIEIDGWLRYHVHIGTNHEGPADAATHIKSPAMIIFEFRKAIDRALTLAFSDVSNLSRAPPTQRAKGVNNKCFRDNHLLVQSLSEGLCQILDTDASHWDEVVREMI